MKSSDYRHEILRKTMAESEPVNKVIRSTEASVEELAALREDLEAYRRSLPPGSLQWAGLVISALALIVAVLAFFK